MWHGFTASQDQVERVTERDQIDKMLHIHLKLTVWLPDNPQMVADQTFS
jgi:hypothetical protein